MFPGKPTPTSSMVSNGVTPTAPVQEDIYDLTYEDQIVVARAKSEAQRKTSKDAVPVQKAPPQK